MAGTAAAFIGAMQAGLAGVISPLVGVLGGDARAMCLVMIASATAALLILATATPVYRVGARASSRASQHRQPMGRLTQRRL
ncbi:MAG: hypothetical protein ACR2JU_03955, partial [Nocardioidaceae bacterium]